MLTLSQVKMYASRTFQSVARAISHKNVGILNGMKHRAMSSYPAPPPYNLTDLSGEVVLITGATSGIGVSCAWRFAELGSNVILAGRKVDKLAEFKETLESTYSQCKVHTVQLDVRDRGACMALPDSLPEPFHDVNVLVNNAGVALGTASVATNDLDQADCMIETNVNGVIYMCRAMIPGMLKRGKGHIINMGSIAGHWPYSAGTVYNASKYAIKGFTAAATHDLVSTPIRVTECSPGMVGGTDFSTTRFSGDNDKAASVYANIEALSPWDVADNVVYAATRPRNVQIQEILMYATNQSGPKDEQMLARVGPSLGFEG